MARRVVFVGGSQARALARVYRAEIGLVREEDVSFFATDALAREAVRKSVTGADVVVTEIGDSGQAVPPATLSETAECIRVPHLDADFLWPFAGQPHPRNTGTFVIPEGPYPAEHGDRFLDSILQQGVGEDEAVARYLALDIAEAGQLDNLLEARLARLAALDEETGFALADFVASRFRGMPLFSTRERLRPKLFRQLAAGVFRRLDAPSGALKTLRISPFGNNAQPIHPGVIRHFGLTWVDEDQLYPMIDEGRFSFEAYCRRYLRFEWNEALHQAIELARTDPDLAAGKLRLALERSPDSSLGQRVLERVLGGAMPRRGAAKPERAVSQTSTAPEDEPDHDDEQDGADRDQVTDLPSADLIEVLPRLLQSMHGIGHEAEQPFNTMPEIMPPPPMDLHLPPEPEHEEPPAKQGFGAKLFGWLRK